MSDSVRPHRWQPTRLPHLRDSPGKSTGVGCHFLLQCMKVKSESEVAQSCPTLSNPMDCSLPGSSVHGIFQARVLEWGAIAFRLVKRLRIVIRSSWSKEQSKQLPICCVFFFFFFFLLFLFAFKKIFPGGPVVKSPCFYYRVTGLIPGHRTKMVPHASEHGQKTK